MYAGFVAQASPPHATVATSSVAPPATSFVAQLPIHVTAAATNSVVPPATVFVAEPPAPRVTAATSSVAPPATSFVVQLPPPAPHATDATSSVTPPATGCTHLCRLPRKSEQEEEVVVRSKPSTEVAQMGAAIVDANKTIKMHTERLDKLQEQVKDLTQEKKDLTQEKKDLSNEKKKLMKQLTRSGELCLMVERLKNQRQEVIDAAHLQQQAATQEVASLTENNASLLCELRTAQLEQHRSNSQIEALEKVCGGRSAPSEFQQELVALRQQLSDVSALEISELQRTVRAQEKLLQSALADAQQEKRRSSLYRRLIGLVDSQLLPDAIVKSLHPEEEQRELSIDPSEAGDPGGKVRQEAVLLLLRQQDDEAMARSKSREIIADVSRLCDENEDLAARVRAAEDKHQSVLRTVEVQEKTILEHQQQSLVAASSPKRAGKVGGDASVVAAHLFPRAAAAADAEVRAPGLMSLFGGLLTSNLACNRCGHIQAAEIGLQALSHALSESQATVLDRVLSELNEHLCEPGSECGLQPISHLLRSYGTLDSQPGSGTGVYVYRPSAQVTAIRVFLLLDQQTAAHYLSQAPLKDEAFAYKLALLYLLLSPQLVCTAEFMDLLLDQVRFLWLPLQLLESEVGEMEQRLLPRAPLGHPAPHLTGSHQKLGYASGGSCICGDHCGDHVYCLETGDDHVAPPTSPPRVPDEVGWTSRAHLIMTRLVPRLEQAIKVKAVFASFLSGGPGRSGSSLHETAALARMHPAVQEELQRARPSYHFLEAAAASVNLAAAAEEEEGLLPRERTTPHFHFKELCRFQVENL